MKQKIQFIRTISFLLLLYIVTTNVFSQVHNTGTNFFVAFGKNDTIAAPRQIWDQSKLRYYFNIEIILRITATAPGKVFFQFTEDPTLNDSISVSMGEIRDYRLSLNQTKAVYTWRQPVPPGALNFKSLQIAATAPINVVAMSTTWNSVEASIVFPVSNLGKEYVHPDVTPAGSGHNNSYIIVATEDNTTITQYNTMLPNLVYPKVMNKGEIYWYPFSGNEANPKLTRVVADKPIAYFQSASRSPMGTLNNYTFEQIPPVDQWGTRFIVPATYNELNKAYALYAKIIAKDNKTTKPIDTIKGSVIYVDMNGNTVKNESFSINTHITNQRYHEVKINSTLNYNAVACYVTTDKPVGITLHHAQRQNVQFDDAQPGVAWVPPVEQRVRNVLVSPLDFNGYHVFMPMRHYLIVVTPTVGRENTTISINGAPPIPIRQHNSFHPMVETNIGGSGYSVGRFYFGESYVFGGNHLNTKVLIDNPDGVLAYAYGQGNYTNYFYTVGAGARALSETFSISGTVSGLPNIAGIPVKFTVNGGVQQITTTNGSGVYTINNIYAGSSVIITASEQTGFIGTVSPLPSTTIVESNITGKNILYTPNSTIKVERTKVFNCHEDSEIDIMALMGHDHSHGSFTFKMIEQPQHADSITGLNSNNNLPYIHHIDFTGKDNLKFSFSCDSKPGIIDTVQLYVFSVDCPDNVVSSTCQDTTTKQIQGVVLRSKTRISDGLEYSDYINSMDVPLVGDIYGDGNIKILAAVARDPGSNNTSWFSQGIAIFDGKTGAYEKTINTLPFHTGSGTRAIAKIDDNVKIFIATGYPDDHTAGNERLVCYDLKTGNLEWSSEISYTPEPHNVTANILVADMNSDGQAEVIAGNKIFNAKTGKLLLDMGQMSGLTFGLGAGFKFYGSGSCDHLPYFPAVADMDNDGVLEFVAGHNIYKIHIPPLAQDTTGSTISLLRTVHATRNGSLDNVGDGATAIADLDGDGYLDVIVTRYSGDAGGFGYPYVYAWNGKTGEMFGEPINLCAKFNHGDFTEHYGQGPSIPVIGDIDGCGLPEIVVSSEKGIHAYKLNLQTKKLDSVAFKETSTYSGSVAMTMFDFDQCGKMELLFHDYDRGYIFSLRNGVTVDLMASDEQFDNCFTHTQNEYPIVADVTGDGRANIIMFGNDNKNSTDAEKGKGYLYIFEGPSENPWAPARNVWNQWAYNAVNVNKDLSIPKYQANPAIMYLSGACGTVHPYNGFLQQLTTLDNDGCYVWPLPNLQWDSYPVFTLEEDSVVITGTVTNHGTAGMMAPIYVTLYENSVLKGNIIKKDSINKDILPGETVTVSFTVKNISNYPGLKNIVVGINDRDSVFPHQMVCEKSKYKKIHILQTKSYAQVNNCSYAKEIDVWNMNQYDFNFEYLQVEVIKQPTQAHPVYFLNESKKLEYYPNQNFVGLDSMEFHVYNMGTMEVVDHILLYIDVVSCPPCFTADWERLRNFITTPSFPTELTIYKQGTTSVTEDLSQGIMVLCENLNFINSNGESINVERAVTLKSESTNDTIYLYTPDIPAISAGDKRHFIVGGNTNFTFTLNNVLIDGKEYAGGIHVAGSGTKTITNATIQYCVGNEGGGMVIDTVVQVIINNCKIRNNTAVHRGGGVFSRSVLNMNSGEISYNKAQYAGGISNEKEGVFNLLGGTISGNVASGGISTASNGGGVNSTGPFNMFDGTITGNYTDDRGAGVYISGEFNMTGGTIENNTAATRGGGIFVGFRTVSNVTYYGNLKLSGGKISNNTATYGAGVYVTRDGAFTMSGGEISNNTATDGAGVYVYFDGAFTMSDGEIVNNTANDGNGGGIYVVEVLISLTGGKIMNNTAPAGEGGAIYVTNPLNISVGNDVIFSGNSAQNAYLLNSSNPGNYLGVTHADILLRCTSGNVAPATISLGLPFQYAYNNYDINYVGGNPKLPDFKIWNWADLAYLNVLIGNENQTPKVSPKLSDYDKFVLMQDLGAPGSNPANYGDGTNCPYAGDRKYGWYGYQNQFGNAPGENNTLIVGDSLDIISQAWHSTEGWIPIGNWFSSLENKAFEGIFDGQGFEINGLWINRTDIDAPAQGLFAFVENSTIQNLGVNFPDSIISNSASGGLVAIADFTTISNCFTTGAIRITGPGNAGGLVSKLISGTINNSYSTCDLIGKNGEDVVLGGLVALAIDSTRINNSYATGNISLAEYGGGLVGSTFSGLIDNNDQQPDDYTKTTHINNSYATGNISGIFAGGLVGNGMGVRIINSYATGNIFGNLFAGGVSGTLYANGSVVNNSYATGSVTGGFTVGGLVGSGFHSGIISNSFALNPLIIATTSTLQVGRVIGNAHVIETYNATLLSNNSALECMQVWVNGNRITPITPIRIHGDSIHGADVTLANALLQNTYTNSPTSWDFTNTWIHSPYNSNYSVATGAKPTNLPILRVFDKNSNNGFFAHAVQPPHAMCLLIPTITVSSNLQSPVCAGDAVTFTAVVEHEGTDPIYQWSVNGNEAGENKSTFTYTPTDGDEITCKLTSSHPDAYPDTATSNAIVMTVIPLNTITLTSAPGTVNQTVCLNKPIDIITYETTGATGANFTGFPTWMSKNWSNNVVTISGTPTTTTTVSYTITLTGGCGNVTAQGKITISALPTITTIFENKLICVGEESSLISYTGGNAFNLSSSTWTNSNTDIGLAASGNGAIPKFKTKNTNDYPITATITVTPKSSAGCVGTPKSFNITVNPLSSADLITVTGIDNICAFETTTLTASAPTVTGTPIFKWYANATTPAILHTGDTYTTNVLTGTTTFYVSAEGDNYCEGVNNTTGRKAVTVTVNPLLKPSVTISIE